MTSWKVVPICKYQQLDVRPEDLLNGRHFRKCDTYRGGGGYDKFPDIAEKRLGRRVHHQFVVQLYGCVLDCPYCYVTRSGVWGKHVDYSTAELVEAFIESGQQIFHLMGGAPAIYIDKWHEIIEQLPPNAVFHSDLLLVEKYYNNHVLDSIVAPNALYAVDIKGVKPETFEKNTRKRFDERLFRGNLERLVWSHVPIYFTFTNVPQEEIDYFQEKFLPASRVPDLMSDYFKIDLINYKAMPYVNIKP